MSRPAGLTGNLEDLSLAEILHVIGISRRSGILHLEIRGRDAKILFREGQVVAATSGRNPASLATLLVGRGVVDATHLEVLDRQAKREGRRVVELLEAEGRLQPGQVEEAIEDAIETLVASLLDAREGQFRLALVKAPEDVADQFGGLLLGHGIPPGRLPGVAERSRPGRLTSLASLHLPQAASRRQAELLVPVDEITLPGLARARSRAAGQPDATPALGAIPATGPEPGHAARYGSVVALAEGRLRSLLEASLNAEGCDTRTVATLEDGEAAAEDLRLQGRPAAVVLDADATATPGLELLARLKLCHRPPPVLAILEADVPPVAQRTARERALRLGASHVVLVPGPAAAEADLAGAAGILAALLSAMTADVATEAGGAVAERIAMLAGEAAWTPLEGVTDPHGVTTAEAQEARLRARATALAGCHELADVALALVDAAAGYWPRAVLFVRSRGAWRALGAHGAGGDDGGLARSAHRLVFPLDAENLVSAAAAAGRVVERTDVSGGDAAVVAGLGRLRPTRLAALPVSPSAPAGSVLYLDDAGAPGDLPDLAPLARFAVTLSADLAAAVATADRRADARRARRTA